MAVFTCCILASCMISLKKPKGIVNGMMKIGEPAALEMDRSYAVLKTPSWKRMDRLNYREVT